jgi:hypothetical protein
VSAVEVDSLAPVAIKVRQVYYWVRFSFPSN